jgi:hypothetical protein
MVKNLPTVERSTKIRFGKNVPDSDVQAENTIIFNASNTLVTTPNSGSIYMSPVRFRSDFQDSNVVLMMYNRVTGELSESGESANSLLGGQTLAVTVDRGNVTSNTVQFLNPDAGIVTAGKMGVSNLLPGHTLSIGSNVYVDDVGSNVLVVSGGVLLDGNLTVNGGVTSIVTENLKIKDAIIELGQNNTSGDTTLDLGLIMTRPQSNVTVGFLESSKEIVMSFTESSADSNVITPLVSEDINVHVYGRLYTEANVGVLNTNPMHTLDVGSNLYVDEFGSNILVVNGNTYLSDIVSVGDKLGVKTTDPDAELHVVGNAYVSSNLTVDTGTLHVDSTTNSVGIETKNPQANLHVVGNTYISSDLTIDTDTFHVDTTNDHVGINTKVPDAELHVVGNTYISDDLTIATDTFHAEASTQRVGIKTKTPDAELHVVGNVYVSSNLTVDEDTLHVDAVENKVGIKTKNPDAELHVVGNVYVSSNLTVDEDTLHVDTTTHSVGVETKFPDANLHVVGNVYVSSDLTVDADTFHVDATGNKVGIKTKNPDAELHVVGNVYVSSNLTVDEDTFHVDMVNKRVGVETKFPDANLHVVGNVYVSSDLTVDEDTFHVDVGDKSIGLGTVNPTSNLHVVGNVYVSSNITTDGTLTLNHPTTALITDLTANVEVKLDQLKSVNISDLETGHTLVYNNITQRWTNDFLESIVVDVKNDNAFAMSKGDAVCVVGRDGIYLKVHLADASDPARMPSIGIIDQDLEPGETGHAITFGRANNVSVPFIESETVYVSNTNPGHLSNVKPYGSTDLIQNIGIVGLKSSGASTNGVMFVAGIGRSNDIPNAPIVADEGDINYVYVNDENNDMKKIEPSNLLTQLQTLQQVTDTGNTTSNTIQFTNVTTGLVTTSNLHVGSNISVTGLANPINKHLPMVGTDGFFEQSPVYVTSGGTYVISAAEAEFLGNITLSGNNTIVSSTSVTIEDRIFGIGANNAVHNLDTGIMMEHKDDGEYANVAVIYHADEHRFSIGYTQNTFTDDHILHYEDADHQMLIDLIGNVEVQHNLVVNETVNVTGDLTVGTDKLFVDVATSRIGVGTDAPGFTLDVHGTSNVGAFSADSVSVSDTTSTTSKTSGAVQIAGGLGISGNVHGLNANFEDVIANSVIINDTTFSESRTTGALVVAGGVGVAEDLYAYRGVFSQDLTVDTNTLKVLGFENRVGINTVAPNAGLHVVGNVYVSSNLTVDTNTLHVDAENNRVGILTKNPVYALDVHGAANVGTLVTTNVYGTLAGSNTVAASDITASGTVKGATLTGTNLYGTLAGANTVATTDLTASGTVKGATLTGTNLYGTLTGSNTVAASDITATGTVKGATLTGTNLYGTLAGSNTVAASDITASATVKGATITGTNLYGTIAGSNAASVSTLTANDTTQATSRTTGAVTIAGGLGVSTNVHAANVYVTGGLVTNTGGVTKKTYSFSNIVTSGGTAPEINVYFTSNVFYSKLSAQLVDDTDEVSTMILEMAGGSRNGTVPGKNIKVGTKNIFGDASSTPWSSNVLVAPNRIMITPSGALTNSGNCHVFMEYTSDVSSGGVSNVQFDFDQHVINFGY